MRRVVIELPLSDVAGFLHEPLLDEIDFFETLALLRVTLTEGALVGRLRFKDPAMRIEDYFTDPSDTVQVLEREKDGSYICFMKGKIVKEFSHILGTVDKGYASLPYELKGGRLKVALLGSAEVIKGFLHTIEKAKLRYKLISLTDAKFSSNSPLGRLTEKQQRVIITAFKLGYYDLPRRVSSAELAKRLNIAEPTLVVHRRRAERHLLQELLRES